MIRILMNIIELMNTFHRKKTSLRSYIN